MGQSVILLIEELAQGMTEAYAAVNDGFSDIEQVLNLPLELSVPAFVLPNTASAYALSEIDLVRYMIFRFASLSANLTVTIPSLTNGNDTHRVCIFVNSSTTYDLILTTDDPGTTVRVPPGATRMVEIEGDDVIPLLEGNYITGFPILINGFAKTPIHLEQFYRYSFTENGVILSNFVGSKGSISPAHLPTLPVRVQISLNNAILGYANVDTSGVFTWEFNTPGDQDIEINDELDFVFLTPEYATITLADTADDALSLLISDGNIAAIPFVFGSGADGTVDKGANATASATNLAAAINAAAFNIDAFRIGTTITLRNNFTGGGGSVVKVEGGQISFADVADAADTVVCNDGTHGATTFTWGAGGSNPATGATAANSATNLKAAINGIGAGTLSMKAYLSTSTLLLIVNLLVAGGGSLTKTDADNDYVITNFTVDGDNDINPLVNFAKDLTAAYLNANVKGLRD